MHTEDVKLPKNNDLASILLTESAWSVIILQAGSEQRFDNLKYLAVGMFTANLADEKIQAETIQTIAR